MRPFSAPLQLVTARARRRPGRWLLPALGIALSAAFAVCVVAEGAVAGDQAARSVLAGLSPLERSVRVTWQGTITPGVARRARRLLSALGLGAQTEVALLNPVRLSGVVVHPAAIAPVARWLPGVARSRLGPCLPRSCPMVLVGGGTVPSRLAAIGVRIPVVGSTPLRSAVPLGFSPLSGGGPPVLVTGDVRGLEGLAGLSGVYRTHSWITDLPAARFHSWQLGALEARLTRSEAGLVATGSQFSLSAPFTGLDTARAQASAAPERLLLAGGGAVAALALFVILAGAGLRRDQLAELQRLRIAGARMDQCVLFVAAECAWVCAIALCAGALLGVLAASVLASAAGEPVGAVLAHSLLTPAGAVALAAAWVLAAAVMTLSVLARDVRVVDLLAIAAASALVAALSVNEGGDEPLALLLAPLCCLAAGVLTLRFAAALLRAGERGARRGPVLMRLALVGLARAPALPSLAIAFIAVSTGLGGFALAYRSTLIRGAADQAADRVPLDAIVSAGPDFNTPTDSASVGRWRAIARGTVVPVRRTDADYLSGGGSVTVPALGVPASAIARIRGWRAGDASVPLAVLARRLVPHGPARDPGPTLPAGASSISLLAASPALSVAVTADLRDSQGAIDQVSLGTAGQRSSFLRARLPRGRWELEALELDEPTGLEITNGHQNAENPAAATQQQVRATLGPLLVLGPGRRRLLSVGLGAWRGVGAASSIPTSLSAPAALISFAASGVPGVLRPEQPSDTRPVPVLVDPQTAAATGPGGSIALTVDGLPMTARVVGVLKRFPTIPSDAAGFVVADEATLASALDAQLPGQGRADELWISTTNTAPLRAALRSAPLAQLSASFRADIERQLRDTPLARAVLGTLIAATAVSALLAVLGLLSALLGGSRDRRIELDLTAQGVGPRGLRTELRARVALASALGVCVGLGIAVLLTRLAIATVGAAGAVAHPRPPLVTVVPWLQLAAWGVAMFAVLVLAGGLAAQSLIRNEPASPPPPVPLTEGGRTLSEGIVR